MSIGCAGKCVVVMCYNLDGFVPFDGFIAVPNLFHCSFQEVVHVFNVTVCSRISGS